MQESNADLLGPDIMRRVGPVGRLDEEGEIRGVYRPSGHPGVRSLHRALGPECLANLACGV